MAYLGENSLKKIFTLIKDYLDSKFGNVENKSSATIRSEITKDNVTDALGYTPVNESHAHDYLPLSGGTVTGDTVFEGGLAIKGIIENTSLPYFIGIEAFADGGAVKYLTKSKVLSAIGGAPASHGRHVPDTCTTITDWNSAVTTGWCMGNGAANAPEASKWFFGYVIAHNANYVYQEVYNFNVSTDAKAIPKYIRAKTNGTWGAWTNVTVSKAVPSDAVFTDTTNFLPLAGGNMTGTVNSSKTTSTFLQGNKGIAIINSTASAGTYTMLDKLNSTNGVFTDGVYQGKRLFQYTSNDTIETGENKVDKSVTLLDESGNSSFPGTVSASAFSGNASSASKWATARNINGMSVQGDANRVNYGTCSTAAATVAKTVACTGFALVTGAEITVKFTVTNTAANPTLNVNSTGAKAIYYRGAAISAGYLAANRTYTFRYNGTQYELVGDINTDSHYTTKLVVGASATANANAAATNGNVYMNVLDNTTVRNAHNIVRTGATTVVSDANGKITINSTNTDCKAASTNSTNMLYLVGTLQQSPAEDIGYTTYSNKNVYITSNCLYSNGKKVSVEGHTHETMTCASNKCMIYNSANSNNITLYPTDGMIATDSASGLTLGTSKNGNITLYGGSVRAYSYGTNTLVPIYGSQFLTSSSKRYKENIISMTDEEAKKLLELNPVKYDYINKDQGVDCYGLIAEEVSDIMSYPVYNDSDGNPDAIDYSKFTPYLIKMVQIQNNEIQDLKQRIEKLESMTEN